MSTFAIERKTGRIVGTVTGVTFGVVCDDVIHTDYGDFCAATHTVVSAPSAQDMLDALPANAFHGLTVPR